MPKGSASVFFVALLLLSPNGMAETRWLIEMTARAYAEPLPVKQFAGDWRGKLESGDQAFTRNRFTVSARQSNFSIAYVQRYDWWLDFSQDTAALYYLHENNLPVPEGREWQVDLHARHWRAQGIRFGWHTEASSGWSAGARLSLLQGMAIQQGRLNGLLTDVSDDYAGVARINYHYDEDLLLADPAATPSGMGWALDLQLGWQSGEMGWLAQAEDVAGVIHWAETPFTRGDIDTDTTVTDPNGFVSYNPTFIGVRATSDYRQRLPQWYRLEGWRQYSIWRWSASAEYVAASWWPELAVARPLARHLQVGAGWLPVSGEWRLRLADRAGRWRLQLGADHWRVEQARAILVEAGVGWAF